MNLVIRLAVVVVGIVATYISQAIGAVQGLWYLSSDMVYVTLFPQLVCVAYFRELSNTYGSVAAYFLAVTLRVGAGEKALSVPPLIPYPFYEEKTGRQLFPVRTFAMTASLLILLAVSHVSRWLFTACRLPLRYDVLGCFQVDDQPLSEPGTKKALLLYQQSDGPQTVASEASVAGTTVVSSCEDRASINPSERPLVIDPLSTDSIAVAPYQTADQATSKTEASAKPPAGITSAPGQRMLPRIAEVPQADPYQQSASVTSVGSLISAFVPPVAAKEIEEEPKARDKKKKRRKKSKRSGEPKCAPEPGS